VSFTIRSNLGTVTPILIRDMGIIISPGGYIETLTEPTDIEFAGLSKDLAVLTTDGAYPGPPDASDNTLIVSDGTEHGSLFDELDEAERNGYKQLDYTNELLSEVRVYKDAGFTTLLYTKTLTYNVDELLIQLNVVRAADGRVFGKLLTYDVDDNVDEVTTYS
jgi:hypothetical protein